MIFYNPITRPNAPCRKLGEICEVDPTNPWLKYKKPYSSRTDVLENHTRAGFVFFRENGKIYETYVNQPFEFVAVDEHHNHDSGIYWGTSYFCTEAEAVDFYKSIHGQKDKIRYNEIYDVYSVHYHY